MTTRSTAAAAAGVEGGAGGAAQPPQLDAGLLEWPGGEDSGGEGQDGGSGPSSSRPTPDPCERCGEAPFKYRCPGCGERTCSLACIKAHKAATACTGKRDRTAFVDIKSLNDSHILSDFKLLEEVTLQHESAKRSRVPQPGCRITTGGGRGGRGRGGRGGRGAVQIVELPPALAALKREALQRGVELLLLQSSVSSPHRSHGSGAGRLEEDLLPPSCPSPLLRVLAAWPLKQARVQLRRLSRAPLAPLDPCGCCCC